MSEQAFRALLGACGHLGSVRVAADSAQAAGAPPEAPQAPFHVERIGQCVAVSVSAEPLTLLEAQDLTARLLVVTGPMFAETLPKERI